MKEYEKPTLDVISISYDVITMSCQPTPTCDTMTPGGCLMGYDGGFIEE